MSIYISKIDYNIYHKLSIPLFLISIFLLILVLFIGVKLNEAKRWINLGILTFQPSEITKTSAIILFSSYSSKYYKKFNKFIYSVGFFLIIIGIISLLLSFEPHLSATLIILITSFSILFVAGIKLSFFISIGTIGSIFVLFYLIFNKYALARIKIWFNPFIDPIGQGWQGVQSFIAIGSGGFFGLGLGRSEQKFLYLPEPANDFIFSIFCEEMGFIGAIFIISVFILLIYKGYQVALKANNIFGCLLAVGITTKIAFQTIINMCVVSGLMPITGASLPFFSYGGTSLLIQLCEIGILLNIEKQNFKVYKGNK